METVGACAWVAPDSAPTEDNTRATRRGEGRGGERGISEVWSVEGTVPLGCQINAGGREGWRGL